MFAVHKYYFSRRLICDELMFSFCLMPQAWCLDVIRFTLSDYYHIKNLVMHWSPLTLTLYSTLLYRFLLELTFLIMSSFRFISFLPSFILCLYLTINLLSYYCCCYLTDVKCIKGLNFHYMSERERERLGN
jgi:hypothetical protein